MKLFYCLFISLLISGCGAGTDDGKNDPVTSEFSAGETVYNNKCVACHQKDGVGVEGAFPPLAQSDYLLADKMRAVAIAANGLNEEITVNGVVYNSMMASQGLSKQEVHDVVNYILNAWGNEGGTVTMDEVERVLNASN